MKSSLLSRTLTFIFITALLTSLLAGFAVATARTGAAHTGVADGGVADTGGDLQAAKTGALSSFLGWFSGIFTNKDDAVGEAGLSIEPKDPISPFDPTSGGACGEQGNQPCAGDVCNAGLAKCLVDDDIYVCLHRGACEALCPFEQDDCCGGHGEWACTTKVDGCDNSNLQHCDDNTCWTCCDDKLDQCGPDNTLIECQMADPSAPYYDPNCLCTDDDDCIGGQYCLAGACTTCDPSNIDDDICCNGEPVGPAPGGDPLICDCSGHAIPFCMPGEVLCCQTCTDLCDPSYGDPDPCDGCTNYNGPECSVDADCDPGEYCNSGECTPCNIYDGNDGICCNGEPLTTQDCSGGSGGECVTDADCDDGDSCTNDRCVMGGVCYNNPIPPDCPDPSTVQCGDQIISENGCGVCFGTGTECPTDEVCQVGVCVPAACTDECSAGERQCTDNDSYEQCGQYDADECLEWGAPTNCAVDEYCDNGFCLPSACVDYAPVYDYTNDGELDEEDLQLLADVINSLATCPSDTICDIDASGAVDEQDLYILIGFMQQSNNEICDGYDNDCDGLVDEDDVCLACVPYYPTFDFAADGVLNNLDVEALAIIVLNDAACPDGTQCDVNGDTAWDFLDVIDLLTIIHGGQPSGATYNESGYCDDTIDNDCDELVDGDDPDCDGSANCTLDCDADGVCNPLCAPAQLCDDDPDCPLPFCGNLVIEPGEQCDGDNWGPIDECSDLDSDYTGGVLSCDATCIFDISNCTGGTDPPGSYCGDGVADADEECDGNPGVDDPWDWGDTIQNCSDFDYFTGGELMCGADCFFNTSGCYPDTNCPYLCADDQVCNPFCDPDPRCPDDPDCMVGPCDNDSICEPSQGETIDNCPDCVTDNCTDECTFGDLECVASATWHICGEYDTDTCLEWSTESSCDPGEYCADGLCVPTVPPECSDTLDNDGDGLPDYGLDPGCAALDDNNESDDSDYDDDECVDAVDDFPTIPSPDSDADGLHDDCDNCPLTYNPNQTDSDGDGIGDACDVVPPINCTDADDDGYATEGGDCGPIDCEDSDPTVYPGATELCNNIDDDCDGLIDDGLLDCACAEYENLYHDVNCTADTDCPAGYICQGAPLIQGWCVLDSIDTTNSTCGGFVGAGCNDGYYCTVVSGDVGLCYPFMTGGPYVPENCTNGIDDDCDGLIDGADPDCAATPTYCGDGTVQTPNDDGIYEQCDDGNNVSYDGCSALCTLETCEYFVFETGNRYLEIREPLGSTDRLVDSTNWPAALTADEELHFGGIPRNTKPSQYDLQEVAANFVEDENDVVDDFLVIDDTKPFLGYTNTFGTLAVNDTLTMLGNEYVVTFLDTNTLTLEDGDGNVLEFYDPSPGDGEYDGTFEVNNENIEDASVELDFATGELLFVLRADAQIGTTVYMPMNSVLTPYLDEPQGLISPRFDLGYAGLTRPVRQGLDFTEVAGGYQMRYRNTRNITYSFTLLSASNGVFRFGTLGSDFVFIEPDDEKDFNVGIGDSFLLDSNGVSSVLSWQSMDAVNRTLTFDELSPTGTTRQVTYSEMNMTNATGQNETVIVGQLVIAGVTHTLHLDETRPALLIDMDGDGAFTGERLHFTLLGGATLGINGSQGLEDAVGDGAVLNGTPGSPHIDTVDTLFATGPLILGGNELHTNSFQGLNDSVVLAKTLYEGPIEDDSKTPWGDYDVQNTDDGNHLALSDFGVALEVTNVSQGVPNPQEFLGLEYPSEQTFARAYLAIGDYCPPLGLYECFDTIDNDGDGLIDYPNDPDCYGYDDDYEGTTPATCGNGIVEPGEECDGNPGDTSYDWGDFNDCTDLDEYTGGLLLCDMTTCLFDVSGCTGGNVTSNATCGDGVINNDGTTTFEHCDGNPGDVSYDWGPVAGCANFGFDDGTLACVAWDSSSSTGCYFNTSGCYDVTPPPTPYCGDGVCNNGETCATCSADCGGCGGGGGGGGSWHPGPDTNPDGGGDSCDQDLDGYYNGECTEPGDAVDCNDRNPFIHPHAWESCNGKDDNCDGIVDEGCDEEEGDGEEFVGVSLSHDSRWSVEILTIKEFTVTIENRNREERTYEVALDLPGGWQYDGPRTVTLGAGDDERLTFRIAVPAEKDAEEEFSVEVRHGGETIKRGNVAVEVEFPDFAFRPLPSLDGYEDLEEIPVYIVVYNKNAAFLEELDVEADINLGRRSLYVKVLDTFDVGGRELFLKEYSFPKKNIFTGVHERVEFHGRLDKEGAPYKEVRESYLQ